MFSKLLIANRGEIACRVIKTAKRMGITTVAIYSDADQDALHVNMADEAMYVGPAPSRESYLRADYIIDVAKQLGVDAIHPGYGFLSENAEFARLCHENGIVFVGPPVGAIEAMGSKSAAKSIMEGANVPLVPGYHGDEQAPAVLKKHADDMGYPVLLKAAAGGGGKGMRQVWSADEFDDALAAAKREAMSSFNDDIMLVEKYLTQPRHVEIQVFCDNHGQGVYLFERDCSVQRRHQKVIEEAPAPGMHASLRKAMGDAALDAARAIKYAGAGTVEFLLDADGAFYFMEMNTRLQVEHPVTELITGEDLVEWQLRVASGERLPKSQDELQLHGHAFEARIYAEDPDNDFLPATGTLTLLQPPVEDDNVRVDTGVIQGDEVSVYYDPMIAKLIVWDEDRSKALARLQCALKNYRVEGVTTNIEFLYQLANHDAFKQAQLTTNFIQQHENALLHIETADRDEMLPAAVMTILLDRESRRAANDREPFSPWTDNSNWRANETHLQTLTIELSHSVVVATVTQVSSDKAFHLTIGEQRYICAGTLQDEQLSLTTNGHHRRYVVSTHDKGYSLFADHLALRFDIQSPDLGIEDSNPTDGGFTAPMNGTVVSIAVEAGQHVGAGDTLLVMEAMKMEHSIKAPTNGYVKEFYYQTGELVDGGSELLNFEAES